MNQNNRFCTFQGHEQLQVNQICTYKQCVNRWCCSQCLNDDIHRHSMPNSDHIMNQEQLSNKVKSDVQNLKNECSGGKQVNNLKSFLQQKDKEFKEIEKQLLDNQISDEDNFKLQELIQLVEGQNFKQLKDQDIYKLLNINQYSCNNDVQLQLQDIQNVKQDQENINNQIIDFKSRQYDIKKIYNGDSIIYSALISRNEQYLVYNFIACLNIYDLKKNKVYQTLKNKNNLSILQFTIDSKILFVGDYYGYVYGYFVTNSFKTFYQQKIHPQPIIQIIIQKQYLITASDDKTIIKTNFINKNQMFKLVGHSYFIISIDYDNLKDILVSTSHDETLKIWDCLNQSIIIDHDFEEYNDIGYIQLINNKQDIIRCESFSFQKFTIDYQNKKLVQTFSQQFNYRLFGFQSVNNDQNLLLIFSDHCKILNKEGELITNIYHNVDLFNRMTFRCYQEQLDTLNYIVLQDMHKLFLLRVKNERN